MKKTMFDIQFFAEDGDEQEQNAEPTKPDTESNESKASELKYSDADLDRILAQKLSKAMEKERRKRDEADKLAQMTAEEKNKKEVADLKRELAELKKEQNQAAQAREARKYMAEQGITVPESIMNRLVGETAEETVANCKEYAGEYKKALQRELKQAYKGIAPKTGTGNVPTITKADILGIKNKKERQEMMRKHQNLFRKG